MEDIFYYYNNRDVAFLFWLAAFIVIIVWYGKTRTHIVSISKTLFSRSILISLFLMSAYVFWIIYFLNEVGFWEQTEFKDLIYWFFGNAFVSLMNFMDAYKEDFFKKKAFESLKFTVLLEFIVNLYVFNLFIEILLLPFLIFITVMIASIDHTKNPEHALVKKFFLYLSTIIGALILLHTLFSISKDPVAFLTISNLKNLILLPILTISFLPFIYLIALHGLYENIFMRVDFAIKENKTSANYLKSQIFKKCLFNLSKLNRFSKQMFVDIWQIQDRKDINQIIQKFTEIELNSFN